MIPQETWAGGRLAEGRRYGRRVARLRLLKNCSLRDRKKKKGIEELHSREPDAKLRFTYKGPELSIIANQLGIRLLEEINSAIGGELGALSQFVMFDANLSASQT